MVFATQESFQLHKKLGGQFEYSKNMVRNQINSEFARIFWIEYKMKNHLMKSDLGWTVT